ncbi:MAG: lactate utilization protein [Candidatus Lokiarchaeota archaeon]|nr:lactate utilization protein [Candidatus Lokiarchaeota archaeon]
MEAKHPEFKKGEDHFREKRINKIIESLKKNGINAKYFQTHQEAVDWLMEKLPDNGIVGVGGSRTLLQIGLIDRLIETSQTGRIKFLDRWSDTIDKKTEAQTRYDNLSADVFITSSNAITLDGKLVNIDGLGNRVAAMMFGPKKVYFIVGRNKIVKDVEAGIDRARNVAAAQNAARFGMPTICRETGICDEKNCYGTRICNIVTIIERGNLPNRMMVLMVNEDLGY